jgi:hypothetical protein
MQIGVKYVDGIMNISRDGSSSSVVCGGNRREKEGTGYISKDADCGARWIHHSPLLSMIVWKACPDADTTGEGGELHGITGIVHSSRSYRAMGVMRMGKSGRERRTALEEVEGGPVQPKGRGVYRFQRMGFDKRRTQSVGNHQHELQRTLACEALMCGIDRHVSFVRAAIMAVELGARG